MQLPDYHMDKDRYFELRYFCSRYPLLDENERKLIKDCTLVCHPNYRDDVFSLVTGWPKPGKKSDIFVENYKKFFKELDRRKGTYDKG